MDLLIIAAAGGLRARMEALDMLANNLANAATAGFKLDRESYSLYVAEEALRAASAGWAPAPALLPVTERHWTDFRQGALTATGNPLDLAISGPGFFVVEGPGGALFTRNGALRLSRLGQLETADGYPIVAAGGGRIQAPPGAPIEVTPSGEVRSRGQTLGRIEVADFVHPEALVKFGRNYFRAPEPAAGRKPAAGFQIEQGKLEASNVAAPEAAVRLVNLLRQFEMLQRAVALGGEMNRRAVEELARVNP